MSGAPFTFGADMVYWFNMSKAIADHLLDIVTAVRALPSDTQEVLVHKITDRVSE